MHEKNSRSTAMQSNKTRAEPETSLEKSTGCWHVN